MLNDQEWELEQARFSLEYWDHRLAEAKKELRKAVLHLIFMVAVFIAECAFVFIFFPFWLGVLTVVVGSIGGIGLHQVKERFNAAS